MNKRLLVFVLVSIMLTACGAVKETAFTDDVYNSVVSSYNGETQQFTLVSFMDFDIEIRGELVPPFYIGGDTGGVYGLTVTLQDYAQGVYILLNNRKCKLANLSMDGSGYPFTC